MKKRILALALATSFLISGCAKDAIDEIINETEDEVTVEASVEASVEETDEDEATEETSEEPAATEEISAADASTEEASTEEVTTVEPGSAEEKAKAIPVKYDETEFCGYYYRDGSDSYLVISAGEKSGTYEITLYNDELGLITGTGVKTKDANGNDTIDIVTSDGSRKGFFIFNPANVMLTLLGVDSEGKADVKINLFPLKAE